MMEDALRVCTESGGKKAQIELLEGAEVRHASSSCPGSLGMLYFFKGVDS